MTMTSPLAPCAALLTVCLLAIQPVRGAGLQIHGTLPGSEASEDYALTVDGQSVFVQKFGDASLSRFSFAKDAKIDITVKEPIRSHRLSPASRGIATQVAGDTLSFVLPEAGCFILQVNALEKLLLLADPPEENPGFDPQSPVVARLTDFLPADRDPEAPVTEAFQRAIDEISRRPEGGVLIVPNGLYVAAHLVLKSHVRLHLESGAVIRALADVPARDYPPQAVDARGDSSFIFVDAASKVQITGRGIIDGNGAAICDRDRNAKIKLLRTAGASDVRIEDVCFIDSARWTLHLLMSERVHLRRVKIVNDLRGAPDPKENVHKFNVPNTDGIDIDACRNVIVEDSFIYTGDDALSPKVTNYLGMRQPCEHLVLRNNVLYSHKAALKIGDETAEDIHDVLFENNDIIRADRAIALWSGDGGRIHDIRVLDNRAEYIGGDYNERFFYFRAVARKAKPGPVEDVLIRDFFFHEKAAQASSILGYDDSTQVTRVRFENIVIGGKPAKTLEDIPLKLKDFSGEVTIQPFAGE